ncbi:TfoX/Sxy family protein [Nocardiopsis sp. RV163]|uniref:TfoX/Sxy family protein n=1 Tax=Nocardiopsis sp. RV163 TaxID=1661388 RepID=UPI00064BF04E|nr:TfoX/Sxy family protein [Nocardiopsis sp. RV163]
MASTPETIRWIVEQLRPLDVHTRAMFGEYGLYCDGVFVGVVCHDTLFLKRNTATDEVLGTDRLAPPYDGARDHHVVPDALLRADDALVRRAVSGAAEVLPPPRRRRR